MKVLLIAPNASRMLGGEAIKAFQYFEWLLDNGHDALLLTHDRNEAELRARFDDARLILIRDDVLFRAMWKSRVLRWGIHSLFHLRVRREIRRHDPDGVVLHYLCPISPVEPRFPPRGYRVIIGPLSGNITYPRAFRHRLPPNRWLKLGLYHAVQTILSPALGDRRRADRLLVSGGARTVEALRWIGCREDRMHHVVDSGLRSDLADEPRAIHHGVSGEFVSLGRLIDLKGVDLSIRAVARTPPGIRLTVFGEGPVKPALIALAERLGVADRVIFAGWLSHAEMPARLRQFRGLIFPSLAEANGIVAQEAMLLGVPFVALRWGGPADLADDSAAILVEPTSEESVVAGLAAAMQDLAANPDRAEAIARSARRIAEERFLWSAVGASWSAHYAQLAAASVARARDADRRA